LVNEVEKFANFGKIYVYLDAIEQNLVNIVSRVFGRGRGGLFEVLFYRKFAPA